MKITRYAILFDGQKIKTCIDGSYAKQLYEDMLLGLRINLIEGVLELHYEEIDDCGNNTPLTLLKSSERRFKISPWDQIDLKKIYLCEDPNVTNNV